MKWSEIRPGPALRRSRPVLSTPRAVKVPRNWIAAVAAVWALVVLYVTQTQLPDNVVKLPGQHTVADPARTFTPQGWAFFTKSPRETELDPYRLVDGGWESLRLGRHSEYGFDRASRSQGLETGILYAEIQNIEPFDCTRLSQDACLGGAPVAVTVVNPSPEPTLCGRVALANQLPVPFAWLHLDGTTHTLESGVGLEVTCP